MKIEELILKLPEQYQEIARRYINLLIDMKFEELQGWVEMLAGGNWHQAYETVVSKMTTAEVLNEQKKANEILKALNKENADQLAAQKEIVQQIFLISLLMLREEIE